MGRKPTRDELRASAFVALAAGAKELYWYGQSALPKGEPLWDEVTALTRELRALSGVLMSPDVPVKASDPRHARRQRERSERARHARRCRVIGSAHGV